MIHIPSWRAHPQVRPAGAALHELPDGAGVVGRLRPRRSTRITSRARTRRTGRSRSTCTCRSAARCAGSAAATSSRRTTAPAPTPTSTCSRRRSRSSPRSCRTGRTASQLHWGGGTPTFLDEQQLDALPRDHRAPLRVRGDAEKAIEIDPAITTRVADRDARASSGSTGSRWGCRTSTRRCRRSSAASRATKETADLVQAARDDWLPRREPRPHLRAAVPDARDAGRARSSGSSRSARTGMAVFGFAYVPWSKPHQRLLPQEALPKTEQRVELFLRRGRGVHVGRATGSSASTTSRSSRTSSRARRTAGTCTGTSRATRSARRRTRSRSG